MEYKRCAKCLYPVNTKPFIHFDEEGICSGCRVAEKKETIEWGEREDKLKKLVEPYKKDSRYDCIIPVSGGKDSHYQVYYVTQVLKMRPLLVTFNHLDNSEEGIRNLENLIVKFGCDHIRFTPNPETVKRCCRHAIKKMADPFWHEHAGIYTFPIQIAVKYNIPLVIWGEYGFLDLTGMFDLNDFIEMSARNRMEHGMRGYEAEDFVEGNEEGLTVRDLEFTKYPSDSDIRRVGVKGIYLGNYIKWDPFKQTKKMIEEYDLVTAVKERTFNIYENSECYFNDTVHDYMKYLKFGYGRATDHASQLIRLGYIDREYGQQLVNEYDVPTEHPKFSEFCKWIEMDEKEVWDCIIDKREVKAYSSYPVFQTNMPSPIDKLFISNPIKKQEGRRIL